MTKQPWTYVAHWLNGKSWRDTVPEARGGGRHAHSQRGWWPGVTKWNGGLPKTGAHQGFNIQSFTEKDCSFSKFEMSGNHILSCNAVKIGINAEVEADLLVGAGLPGWSFTGMTLLVPLYIPCFNRTHLQGQAPSPIQPITRISSSLKLFCWCFGFVFTCLSPPTWVYPLWRQGPFLLGWKLYPQSLDHSSALSRLNNVIRWTTISDRNIMLQGPSYVLTLLP